MAMVAGIQHIRDGVEAQVAIGADMAIIGLIGLAPNADALKFPLNTPVFLLTSDASLRASLGTTGTIPDALALLSAQLEGVGAAKVIIVRVADDPDPFIAANNIVGVEANGSGMWAFLNAPDLLGFTPRVIIAPGFTHQTKSGVDRATIGAAGAGYTSAPTVTFAAVPAGPGHRTATGVATIGGGAVIAVTMTDKGYGYAAAPAITFAGGGFTTVATATSVLDIVANIVCANIPTILDRLKAVFIPGGPTDTRVNWLKWRTTLPATARILHPLRQNAVIGGVNKPLSPAIAGIYITRDAENGGVPGKSAANQSIKGIEGVTPSIPFSIIDGNSQGQLDLEVNAGIVVRGQLGVDGALTDSGFAFWGTDTLSADSSFLFAHVVRMRDYMEILQIKTLRYFLGRFNITTQTLQAVYNTLEGVLSPLRADGFILDYQIKIEPGRNTAPELRLGNVDITFRAEVPPVLRLIKIRSRGMVEALDRLVQQVSTAIDGIIQ